MSLVSVVLFGFYKLSMPGSRKFCQSTDDGSIFKSGFVAAIFQGIRTCIARKKL